MSKQPLMIKAEKMASYMLRGYKKEGDCGDLLIEWAKECFWGALVKEHLPIFDKVWKVLDEKGHTRNNKFVYGDIDVGLWVEYPKNKKSNKRIIISERYCSCADDNIHLFIENGKKWLTECPILYKFKVVTAWPRQINSKYGKWKDDRDIDKPSLNTYRKRGYTFGYGDGRDKGHSILYQNGRVDKAHWNEGRIKHALWTLRGHLGALESDNS